MSLTPHVRFANRTEAGERLAAFLQEAGDPEPYVILGIPGGGVAVGRAVADRLHAPLGALVARKIALPSQPEYAVGAVTAEGPAVWNEETLPPAARAAKWRAGLEETARRDARRLAALYGRVPSFETAGTVIVVDDGLATGYTVLAALAALPRGINTIVAVPVASVEAVATVARVVPVRALAVPGGFYAVGAFYDDFHHVAPSEVVRLLDRGGQR